MVIIERIGCLLSMIVNKIMLHLNELYGTAVLVLILVYKSMQKLMFESGFE